MIETEGYRMENALNSSHSIAAMTETVPENGRGGRSQVAGSRRGAPPAWGDVIRYLADFCQVLGKVRWYGSSWTEGRYLHVNVDESMADVFRND